jgi:hypothetical protein
MEEIIEKTYQVKIIEAPLGKFLTQKNIQEGDVRIFVTRITVTEDTKENYRIATQEEKDEYENTMLAIIE